MYELFIIGVTIVFLVFTGHKVYQIGAIRENIRIIRALKDSLDRVPADYKAGALYLANIQIEEMEKAGIMGK